MYPSVAREGEARLRYSRAMFKFFTPKISSFGIDLSDLSIKVINLKKHAGTFVLACFNRQDIKEGLIEEGEIKQETELIEVIKKAVSEVKGETIKTKYCIVSLPETESYIRMLQLPLIKEEEVAEAIKWELEANIPHAIDEIYYDWQIIQAPQTNQKQLDILVGVLPKKTVDPYLDALKKADLKPFIFEIESVATARALIKDGYSEEPIAIVDMGAKRTSFFIFSGRTIYFTTSLPICNNSLIKTLSAHLDISIAKAREIKLKVGLDSKHPKSQIFEALKPPLMELATKIKNFIDFYQDHWPSSNKINKVLLCGGGAKMVGLPEFLNAQLKLVIDLGNPWINISDNPKSAIGKLPFDDPPAYTTALGLALRGWEQ